MAKAAVGFLLGAVAGGGIVLLALNGRSAGSPPLDPNLSLSGLLLGVFIGFLSSIAALVYLWTAAALPLSSDKTIRLMAALLAIALFALGGTWLSSLLLAGFDWPRVLPSYLGGLVLIFGTANSYPLFRLALRVGGAL